jgi:hypothetical protein
VTDNADIAKKAREAFLECVKAYGEDMADFLLRSEVDKAILKKEIENLKAAKDQAYAERNKLVRLLTCIFKSGIAKTNIDGWDPEWENCVYINTHEGQMSWHIHESELDMFAHLEPYKGPYDGHTTEEKYERLYRLGDSQRRFR